jgi:hypothetical protein
MAVTGVRRVDAVRHPPAHQPPTGRAHLLHLLRRGWARAAGVLLSLHYVGVLRALASAPVTTLPRSGCDLHPLL